MLRFLFSAFLILLLVFRAQTHDYHTSLTEVRYNPKSKTLEVAVKVFTDDLETALSTKHKTKIILSKTDKIESLVANYVKEKLQIRTSKGTEIGLRYIGREAENDVAWLYLESAEVPVTDLKKLTITNRILTEIFNDQMNILTLEIPGKKSSFLFNQSSEKHLFE